MHKHVLITGAVDSGKTTAISRILRNAGKPVCGFSSQCTDKGSGGPRKIYLFSPASPERRILLLDSGNPDRARASAILDSSGVELLSEIREDGIILMDELGVLESNAPRFMRKVLDLLDGTVPVLAAVKAVSPPNPFLTQVCSHPNTKLYQLTPENRDELPDIIMKEGFLS